MKALASYATTSVATILASLCDYFHHYNRNRCATVLAAIITPVMFSQPRLQPEPYSQPLLQPALTTTTQQLGVKTATEVGVRAIQDHKVIEWNTCWKCRLSEGTDDM